MTADERISVVVITHNRRDELQRTLERLAALPEQPRVVVVDNASSDGTADGPLAASGRHLADAGPEHGRRGSQSWRATS